jgi:hypothetical protein
LNPQKNLWDEIREKIFKNYALKSMSDVNAKLDEAAPYIERNARQIHNLIPLHSQVILICGIKSRRLAPGGLRGTTTRGWARAVRDNRGRKWGLPAAAPSQELHTEASARFNRPLASQSDLRF